MAFKFANYSYVIGDRKTEKCVIVDGGGWDVTGILKFCKIKGFTVSEAIFTHRHADHTGGLLEMQYTPFNDKNQRKLPGVHDFIEQHIPCRVGTQDIPNVATRCEVPSEKISPLVDNQLLQLGSDTVVKVLHTPGHTSGSVCFLLGDTKNIDIGRGLLFTGDTLFIGSCGRSDLPESSPSNLLKSLAKLARLHEDTIVLPGHNYAMPTKSSILEEKETNQSMRHAMTVTASMQEFCAEIRYKLDNDLLGLEQPLDCETRLLKIYKAEFSTELARFATL